MRRQRVQAPIHLRPLCWPQVIETPTKNTCFLKKMTHCLTVSHCYFYLIHTKKCIITGLIGFRLLFIPDFFSTKKESLWNQCKFCLKSGGWGALCSWLAWTHCASTLTIIPDITIICMNSFRPIRKHWWSSLVWKFLYDIQKGSILTDYMYIDIMTNLFSFKLLSLWNLLQRLQSILWNC